MLARVTRQGRQRSRRQRNLAYLAQGSADDELSTRGDPRVGVIRRTRTGAPQAELLRPRPLGSSLEKIRVRTPAIAIEIRCCGTDGDETDIDVEPIVGADDVTQQPAVLIDAVRRRLDLETHSCPGRKQRLRPSRRRLAVALDSEENLRRIYLNEAHAPAVAKDDGVSVGDVVDAVDGRSVARLRARCAQREYQECKQSRPEDELFNTQPQGQSCSQAMPS